MRSYHRRLAFTVVEMLVVFGILMLLLALLLPALTSVRKHGVLADSMSNLKQIASWMTLYAQDNRDTIVPSRFNYTQNSYPGKVRSVFSIPSSDPVWRYRGTWTDILWTINEVGASPDAVTAIGHNYQFDSPDTMFYQQVSSDLRNPFRSSAANTANANPAPPPAQAFPLPFGLGAQDRGDPGYFAANNFFNADQDSPTFNGWFATSQIRQPAASLYAIDSFWGEVIEVNQLPGPAFALPDCAPWSFPLPPAGGPAVPPTGQVDFRYVGDNALILFLDGRVATEGRFQSLNDLEANRHVRVRNLLTNESPAPPCP